MKNIKYTVYQIRNKINHMIYVGVHAINKNGKKFLIEKDDIRLIEGELFIPSENKSFFKRADGIGRAFMISIYNPKVLSGEFIPYKIGKKTGIRVKDKHNSIFLVDKNDPRILSGELIRTRNSLIRCIDINGNKFRVRENDPKILSGELILLPKIPRKFKNR